MLQTVVRERKIIAIAITHSVIVRSAAYWGMESPFIDQYEYSEMATP